MSTISNLIFHGAKHKLTSPFGQRSVISTSNGSTSSFHSGVDYGTYNIKLPQYAIADGSVLSCGVDTAYGNAKYVWVSYPSLGVKMLHYHLDSIAVKSGQAVNPNTILGYTGKTGIATGIHLHLGLKRISGGSYIDAEKWSEEEYSKLINGKAAAKYEKGNYRVTADVLNVRSGPGTAYSIKTFSKLTADAQTKISKLSGGAKINGYVKGLAFTVLEVKYNWGRSPSGWVCLDYCKKIS